VSATGRPAQPADVVFGLAWAVLGVAITVGSWRMDRLERQGVEPYAVPGLLPGLLGLLLLLFGLLLALRGWRGRTVPAMETAPAEATVAAGKAEPWRAGLALLLTGGFVLGLLGRGPPFWLAGFLFVFLAIFLFELPERRARGTLPRGAVVAAVIAVVAAGLATLVFQEVFLVRLP
jgi:Tripartite tricarboxylate transporter TctB family